MGLFNRITATVVSSVDRAVTRVENHDAVVEALAKDTRQAGARAQVRLARVRQDGEKLRRKLAELKKAKKSWTDRARKVAGDDEAMALQCVQRRQNCINQIGKLEDSLRRHVELEDQVTANLEKIQARLEEITQQRNMMRSRQSAAEALRVINQIEGTATSEVEETFDRWEILVTESEYAAGSFSQVDRLESTFIEQEDEEGLRSELALLLATSEDNDDEQSNE